VAAAAATQPAQRCVVPPAARISVVSSPNRRPRAMLWGGYDDPARLRGRGAGTGPIQRRAIAGMPLAVLQAALQPAAADLRPWAELQRSGAICLGMLGLNPQRPLAPGGLPPGGRPKCDLSRWARSRWRRRRPGGRVRDPEGGCGDGRCCGGGSSPRRVTATFLLRSVFASPDRWQLRTSAGRLLCAHSVAAAGAGHPARTAGKRLRRLQVALGPAAAALRSWLGPQRSTAVSEVQSS